MKVVGGGLQGRAAANLLTQELRMKEDCALAPNCATKGRLLFLHNEREVVSLSLMTYGFCAIVGVCRRARSGSNLSSSVRTLTIIPS